MANRYRDIKICHVLALDTITDPNRDDLYMIVAEFPEIDYALIYRGTRTNPWVAAWGLKNINQGKSWSQGHYFATIEGAIEYIQGLKNGIPYCRMEEIASKAIDGLFEDEPYEAEIYCEETLELTNYEREFFGIADKIGNDWNEEGCFEGISKFQ
jgi:hypothetical protein